MIYLPQIRGGFPTTVAKAGTPMLTIAAAPMIPIRPTVLAVCDMVNAMFATLTLGMQYSCPFHQGFGAASIAAGKASKKEAKTPKTANRVLNGP